jgi:hypothetical protein
MPQDNLLLLDIPVKQGTGGVDHEDGDNVTMLRRLGTLL